MEEDKNLEQNLDKSNETVREDTSVEELLVLLEKTFDKLKNS
jgi:hypothetical protein